MILAGVMLKLGTYGFLRFGLYLFPDAAHWCAPLFITLGVIGIIYGAICATMQRDLKRLVAYSSVAHLGFIVLGTFALTTREHLGRRAPDGQPRHLDRRPVPPRRLDLRAPPHPRDRRAARPAEGGADLRRRLHRGDAVVDRRARPQRLRRRVPHADRLVPHRPLVGGRRRHRRDPRRALPAVGLPAGVPRRARRRQPPLPRAQAARRASSCCPSSGSSSSWASTRSRCSTASSRACGGSSPTSRPTPTTASPTVGTGSRGDRRSEPPSSPRSGSTVRRARRSTGSPSRRSSS